MICAPIALFVYNRLDHLRVMVESLKRNKLSKFSDLTIFSDGPKLGDEFSVLEVRNYLKTITGFKSIEIVEQNKNLGLAESIITGVSRILSQSENIIVLEDDIYTSEYFLDYMNSALQIYKNEKKVFHISGYLPDIGINFNEHVFLKPASCWGWATWKDRWTNFSNDSAYYLSKFAENKELIKVFNHNNSYDYYSHLKLNHNGKLRTWAIFWYLSVFFNNGICLHPCVSYTRNIGHDGSGQNCKVDDRFDVELSKNSDFKFPENIEINCLAEEKLIKFYLGLKISLIRRIINKLNNFISINNVH